MYKHWCAVVLAYLLFGGGLLLGCSPARPQSAPSGPSAARAVPTAPSPVAPVPNSTLAPTPSGRAEPTQPRPSPLASPLPAGEIDTNITQAEYAQALARWRARGVSEYEITLIDHIGIDYAGKVRLRIQVVGGEPRVLGDTDLNGDRPRIIPVDTLSAYDQESLRSLSVEDQFRFLGRILFTDRPTLLPGTAAVYEVTFDPVLGYPTRVHSFAAERRYIVPDSTNDYDVLSVHILQSSAPGMPKTGHPGP